MAEPVVVYVALFLWFSLLMLRYKHLKARQNRRHVALKRTSERRRLFLQRKRQFRRRYIAIALSFKTPVMRSVWCKKRSKSYWEAAKRGDFGDHWWYENLRLSRPTFIALCSVLQPYLQKQATRFRLPVGVDEQIAVTLWRLATNVEYRTIFGLGVSTVCVIVLNTCHVMSKNLLTQYVTIPKRENLKEIIRDFEMLWGFPQAVGAIDGTHIPILKPVNSPSDYYNRKGYYSILMQAVVDSRGRFIDVNIGWPGKVHDARVLVNSTFYRSQMRGELLPNWTRSINGVDIPLLILGDPAYPLLPWLIKAYPETGSITQERKYFNYRQSRARMVVENAFGRLKGRWRCLLKRMDYYETEHAINVIASCVILHNICESQGDVCDLSWIHSEQAPDTAATSSSSTDQSAMCVRDAIKNYLFQSSKQ